MSFSLMVMAALIVIMGECVESVEGAVVVSICRKQWKNSRRDEYSLEIFQL
jgi:hypothetical protein